MSKVTKSKMLEYFERKGYSYYYDRWPVSWNVKLLGGIDVGKGDEYWDERWEEWLEDNPDFFWDACINALRALEEELLDVTNIPFAFNNAGRSGGHLVLERWGRHEWHGRDSWDFEEWPVFELRQLHEFCLIVDMAVEHRHSRVELQFQRKRDELEKEWDDEDEELSRHIHGQGDLYVIVNFTAKPYGDGLSHRGEFCIAGETPHTYGSLHDAATTLGDLMYAYDHAPDSAVICRLEPVPIADVEQAIAELSEDADVDEIQSKEA